ncbi:hypothetical protein [Novosphingobium sp. HII-3]|uniref:hypothetical protein n=1 Tax=Novosphingobium sp. HII-3 TaxID=2075565 RepID=UPI001304DADC|nr:hypothetical protein [Novosphingobium sp. HII-3]
MSVQPKVPGQKESAASKLGAFLGLLAFVLGFAALLTVPHPITQLAAELMAPEESQP